MHDGAQAHFSRAVRDVINNTYHDRLISSGGPSAWPPRLPDFNPLDFELWEHLKSPVYAAPVDKEEALNHCSVTAYQTVHLCPGIFARMWLSMMRRVHACIESHGGHFEHLL
jgi:hypothetical protein